MTNITFTPGSWEDKNLTYAYSWRFPELPEFRQEPDCIVNNIAPGTPQLYDYMGLMLPETYTTGAKISACCSFEDYAAPMLVISPENEVDENGILRTLDYYEIVIWRNGLNVWHLSTENRKVTYYKVLGATFPVALEEKHTLSVEILDRRLVMQLDEMKLELYIHDLPGSFRLGYTACEGYCRLYQLTAEQGE